MARTLHICNTLQNLRAKKKKKKKMLKLPQPADFLFMKTKMVREHKCLNQLFIKNADCHSVFRVNSGPS